MPNKVIQRGVPSWGARTHDPWLKRPEGVNSSYDRLAMPKKVIQRDVSSWGARTHGPWLKRPSTEADCHSECDFLIMYRRTKTLAQTVETNFESKLIAGYVPATYSGAN